MDFSTWLNSNGFNAETMSEPQKLVLQATWRRELADGNTGTATVGPDIVAGIYDGYAANNPDRAAHLAERRDLAISQGWDRKAVELDAMRVNRFPAPNTRIPSNGGSGNDIIEAALLVKSGHSALAEKLLGPRSMEMSRKLHSMSLVDLAKESLRRDGRNVPSNRWEMLASSLSTGSMPTALGAVANKIAEASYALAPATWRSFSGIRSAANFHSQTSIRPTFAFGLEEVPLGGEVRHGSFDEETFAWQVGQYAKQISIDRKNLVNDDLSVLAEVLPSLSKAAGRSLSDLIYRALLANANSHFSVGHANYASGGGSALQTSALATAVQKLRRQVDSDGNNLDLQPAVLLVPPELEVTARGLLQSAEIARSTASDGLLPTGNTFQNLARLEVESRLSNSAFTGYSTTGWYLFASPSDVPMVVGFLDGVETPTVTTFGFDTNPDKLAMTWRVHFDYGTALGD